MLVLTCIAAGKNVTVIVCTFWVYVDGKRIRIIFAAFH